MMLKVEDVWLFPHLINDCATALNLTEWQNRSVVMMFLSEKWERGWQNDREELPCDRRH